MSNDVATPPQFYKVAQLAAACQVSEDSILEDIRSGDLVAINVSKGTQRPRWRISETEFGRYLARKQFRASVQQPRRRRAR